MGKNIKMFQCCTEYEVQPVTVDVLWAFGSAHRASVTHGGGRGRPGQVGRGVV